jgi:hypothetical protein
MKAVRLYPAAMVGPLLLSSCASMQLNSNTVELSSTIDDVYTRETLNNISKFIDNKYSIPSQMSIGAGVFQTVNTVNPSLTVPITGQVAKTATNVITGVASGTGETQTRVGTLAGAGAGISATNTQQQNYTVAPLNDEIALMNQQALYQHVVWNTNLLVTYTPSRVFVNKQFFYDPFALQYPQCVLCSKNQDQPFDSSAKQGQNRKDLVVNPRLAKGGWIHWDVSGRDDLVDLGHYGNHELFMDTGDFSSGVLTNFVLATLSYSSPTETFGGGTPSPPVVVIVPTSTSPPGPGGAPPSTPKVIVPQIIVPPGTGGPPGNNYRVPPADRPGFNLVIPQQINP